MAGEDPSIGAPGSPPTRMPAATDSQVPVHSQGGNATAATAGTSQPHLALASSASSSAAGPSHSSNAGPSTSSSTSLDTIDDVCNAIFTITVSGGDANAQYKLVSQSLLPALQHLDLRGTGQGVPGGVVLSSALQGNQDPLQALLTQIPPGGLGVGYLYILVARCNVDNANAQYLVNFIMQYIQAADVHQMRLAPHKVNQLANALSRFMRNQPADSIPALIALNQKFQGENRNFLTAIHPLILYAALQSGQLGQAIALLRESPVSDVDVRKYPIAYQENLKYHLYGGLALSTIGDYEHSAQLLETAIAAPCHAGASSLVQIDAYKHYVLVQLLKDGKTTPLPKYTSPALLSSFKQLCNTPYLEFTKAYENLDTHKLVELITQHRKVFEQDATAGLVNRCMRMIPSRKILKLGNVYKTIELEEVVRNIQIVQTNPDPAAIAAGQIIFPDSEQAKNFVRQAVQALVAERKLTAIIKPAQAPAQGEYLEFLVVRPSPVESAQALQRSLALIRNSSWSVSQLDKSISSSRDFLNKAYTLSGRGTGSGAGAGGMDHGFDASAFHPGNFAAEEDLLGDKEMRGSDIWDD